MSRTDFLKPLNDLSYCCECAALDYTGELKTELSDLCHNLKSKSPGYEAQELQMSLPKLEAALEIYYSRDLNQGAMLLSSVSREWWLMVEP